MENNTEDFNKNILNLYFDTDSVAEAFQDFLEKIEVISPNRRIISMNIPIAIDEDGNVPIIIELSGENEGLN